MLIRSSNPSLIELIWLRLINISQLKQLLLFVTLAVATYLSYFAQHHTSQDSDVHLTVLTPLQHTVASLALEIQQIESTLEAQFVAPNTTQCLDFVVTLFMHPAIMSDFLITRRTEKTISTNTFQVHLKGGGQHLFALFTLLIEQSACVALPELDISTNPDNTLLITLTLEERTW